MKSNGYFQEKARKMSVSCNTIRDNVTLREKEREERREVTLNSPLPFVEIRRGFIEADLQNRIAFHARNVLEIAIQPWNNN